MPAHKARLAEAEQKALAEKQELEQQLSATRKLVEEQKALVEQAKKRDVIEDVLAPWQAHPVHLVLFPIPAAYAPLVR